ncbi:hypothetical protein JN11_01131 [Mucilaginibacter frigoritolerans]|uniref:DUF5689 domain-containing protein n=1 Tax=Mucilaginibacter frigoritolerans TaxID=652788 RepID=A0A562UDW4_9SPHI|nr:hypothetical protein [Mucilaginibacter frigoritolerans]TWJ03585.1 hypothetical protein JN11_01131 [Mucilaginibacter frigoritolerans]
MKKTTIIALAMLLGLSACKKDASTINQAPSAQVKARSLVVSHNYVDLTLMPRAAGQNYDTYQGVWQGLQVTVLGPLSWNIQQYPTLVNGVPLVGASVSTSIGSDSYISEQNSGPDGNVFAGSEGVLEGGNYAQFQASLDNYYQALDNYFDANASGTPPLIGDYVNTSYSSVPGFVVFTGKLIRVTTGSNVAIADIGYPLPTASTTTIPSTNFYISDPDQVHYASVNYALYGSNGVCKNATIENSSTVVVISASYTYLGNGIFQFWGTIIRTDGTSFSFNITDNPS